MTAKPVLPRRSSSYVKIVATWCALVALTVVSWAESEHASMRLIAGVLLAVTAIKVVMVLRTFMELDRAPLWLQTIAYVWLAAVVAIVGIFATG